MDIPALSIQLSQSQVQQQADISVMKMAMSSVEESSDIINQMMNSSTIVMEQSVNPNVGASIDIQC